MGFELLLHAKARMWVAEDELCEACSYKFVILLFTFVAYVLLFPNLNVETTSARWK